jgi:hypothetical protein
MSHELEIELPQGDRVRESVLATQRTMTPGMLEAICARVDRFWIFFLFCILYRRVLCQLFIFDLTLFKMYFPSPLFVFIFSSFFSPSHA